MKLDLQQTNAVDLPAGNWAALLDGNGRIIALFRSTSDAAKFMDNLCPAGKLIGVRVPE